MKKLILTLLLFVFALPCLACLNGDSYLLKNKQYLYMDYDNRLPFGHNFFTNQFAGMIHDLDRLYRKTNNLDYLSDKALVLILKKQYNEAMSIYLDIEKREPGRYSTASNLGTIYELTGKNKDALEWIKKAVMLNPHSHESSEWLHVNILEAKVKGAAFYTSLFLTNLDFGVLDAPKSHLSSQELAKLDRALYFQLNERISFIGPKDEIIAVLLFDLANIRLLQHKVSDAKEIFEKAKVYGMDSKVLHKRMLYIEKLNHPMKKDTKINSEIDYVRSFTLIVIGLVVVYFGMVVFRRRF